MLRTPKPCNVYTHWQFYNTEARSYAYMYVCLADISGAVKNTCKSFSVCNNAMF